MSQRNLNKYLKKFEQTMPLFHRSMAQMNACCVEEMNLTPHQYMALKIIANTDNCSMSDLSKKLGVTMGNMTAMVDRLIKEGFASREHELDDRRIVRVKLTAKGKKAIARATEKRQNMILNVLEILSDKDIETLLGLMEKIVSRRKSEND